MAKRFYKVNEKVWIKGLKRVGRVEALDIPNLTTTVSYYKEGQLIKADLKFMEIDKLVPQKKEVVKPKKLTILVKYFDNKAQKIEKISIGDWVDLRSATTVEYEAGDFIKLHLGVAISLPFGYEAHVAPRSSTFKNFGVIQTNSIGIVDESYRGNEDYWFVPFYALRGGKVEKGDRVCQFRIVKKMEELNIVTVDELKAPNRGGFGGTGIK